MNLRLVRHHFFRPVTKANSHLFSDNEDWMVSVSLSYLYSRSINWWHLCFFWLKLYQNSISFTLGIKFEIAVELRDKKQIVLSLVLYGSQYFSRPYEPKASHYFLHYQLVFRWFGRKRHPEKGLYTIG